MEDLAVPRRRFARRRVHDPDELIVATIAEHAESLLRIARRHTRCQADAEDAYQRALEIFVKQAHRLDPATVHKWLHTVLKHECWAVCEQRAKYVGVDDDAVLDVLEDGRVVASVEERAERQEDLLRAAEALKRLKPQEVTALMLKAQGLSYQEIADRQSWTYTKVNRCITEGRKSFLERYAGIQSGEECSRWLPVLSAMADGEATAEQLVDARPHLRNCPACRSVLGDMRHAHAPVAALLPPAVLGGAAAAPTVGLLDRLGELFLGAQDRVAAPLIKAQSAVEAASSMKMAAVAASTVAIAGGGVAVERQTSSGDARAAGPAPSIERITTMTSESRAPIASPPLRPPAPVRPAQSTAPPANEPRQTPRTPPDGREPEPNTEFAPETAGAATSADLSLAEPPPRAQRPTPTPAAAKPAANTGSDEFDALGG